MALKRTVYRYCPTCGDEVLRELPGRAYIVPCSCPKPPGPPSCPREFNPHSMHLVENRPVGEPLASGEERSK